jgi:hypothetical protein
MALLHDLVPKAVRVAVRTAGRPGWAEICSKGTFSKGTLGTRLEFYACTSS